MAENDKFTILLIDDDKDLLVALRILLLKARFRVLTASNGSEGWQVIQESQPDVIVCDVMMPPPNGFELRKMAIEDPEIENIPFIFLTSRSGGADKQYAMVSLGAYDYVVKPFEPGTLIDRLQHLMDRERLRRLHDS